MRGSFIKHFAVLSAGTIANMILGFLTTPIITRMVDPASYGQYSLFMTYGNLAFSIVGLGMDCSLVRFFYSGDERYKAQLVKLCYLLPNLALCAVSGIAIILVVILPSLLAGHSMALLLVFILYVALLLTVRYSGLVLRLNYRTNILAWTSVVNKVVFVVVAIGGLWLSQGKYGSYILIFALLCGSLVVTIYGWIPERKLWIRAATTKEMLPIWQEVLKYSLPFVITTAAATFLSTCGQVFLGSLSTSYEVGIYAAAISITHIMSVIQSTFNTLWVPMSVEHFESDQDDQNLYIKAFGIMSLLMLSFGLILIAAKDMIVLLLGASFAGSATTIPFLMLQPVFYTLAEISGCGMIFMKRSDYQLYCSVISGIFCAILCIILVPRMGSFGAAISTGLSYIVYFYARWYFSNRVYPIDFGLNKSIFATLALVLFCLISTRTSFSIITIVAYIITQAIFVLLFKSSVPLIFDEARKLFIKTGSG